MSVLCSIQRRVYLVRRVGLILMIGFISTASALTLPELQGLLRSSPLPEVGFRELRESPWLTAPVESSGRMRLLPDGLEKRVEVPKQEIWRLLSDRMVWLDAQERNPRQILYTAAPGLATLAATLRKVVSGDLLALQSDFRITVQGDAKQWRAHLDSLNASPTNPIDQLSLQGTGTQLLLINMLERKGERTTFQFSP